MSLNQNRSIDACAVPHCVGYTGRLSAIASYPDEMKALRDAGSDLVFNLYAEDAVAGLPLKL